MTFDPATVRLGKKLGVVHDPRTFRLASLLVPSELPAIPTSWRMARSLHSVPMFANDRIGDCTCASSGHQIIAQERSSGQHEIQLSDKDIIAAYAAVTGYPVTGDNGAYMLDVANYRRRTGIGREKDGTPHTVDAFVKVDHAIRRQVMVACVLFGGVWIGVSLPNSAQAQTGPDKTWHVTSTTGDGEPGSWGGHAITVVGFDQTGPVAFTWGAEQRMTWQWFETYCDEAYGLITEDWFRKSGTSPRGFRMDQLRGWLSKLA